jgi:hypothetical protein
MNMRCPCMLNEIVHLQKDPISLNDEETFTHAWLVNISFIIINIDIVIIIIHLDQSNSSSCWDSWPPYKWLWFRRTCLTFYWCSSSHLRCFPSHYYDKLRFILKNFLCIVTLWLLLTKRSITFKKTIPRPTTFPFVKFWTIVMKLVQNPKNW